MNPQIKSPWAVRRCAVVVLLSMAVASCSGGSADRSAAGPAVESGESVLSAEGDLLAVDLDVPCERETALIVMPDGSRLRGLNGVTNGQAPRWPSAVSYSPPLRVETAPDGTEWYVHDGGVHWTTVLRFRPDLGREDAATLLGRALPESQRVPVVRLGETDREDGR